MVSKLLKNKENGNASMTMIFVLIFFFVLTLITYSLLTVGMLMTHQHEVDDVLVDAVLASAIANEEYYFKTREEGGTVESGVVKFLDVDYCHDQFIDCINTELNYEYDKFFSDLVLENVTFYEVEGMTVKATSFNSLGEKSVSYGTFGSMRAPTGAVIERTSVYGKISFTVHAYFCIDISHRVSRDLYSTIRHG